MSIKEIIKHDFRQNRMMEIIYILKAMEGGGVQAISSGSGTSCGTWALGLELNQPTLPIYLKKKKNKQRP